ncbi:hypothetical protein ACHAXT_003165 [Thalassiosira profunda]
MKKHLEYSLSSLPHRVFADPKIELEQYPTSAHLAASVVLSALERGDAGPGRTVCDLGAGTGMLGLGFALANSDLVYLVDCDETALALARENVDYLQEEELIGDGDGSCLGVELVLAKVKYDPPKREKQRGGGGRGRGGRGDRGRRGRGGRGSAPAPSASQNEALYSNPQTDNADDGIPLPSDIVDTVITNPPFGTKNNEGIDVQLLKAAVRLARQTVYSFHKTSTRPFLLKLLNEKWGLEAEVVAEMKFDVPNMYKFHKQKSKDIEVDLLRVQLPREEKEDDDDRSDGIEKQAEDAEGKSEGEEMPLGLCGHA